MTSDDYTLWQKVIQTITPLYREDVNRVDSHPSLTSTKANSKETKDQDHQNILKPFPNPQKNKSFLKFSPLDRKTQRKIDKGKIPIDGKLDLHGMTRTQAHQRLISYIKQAAQQDKKHLIIVTGKGSQEKGTGVIRRELPFWLQDPNIASLIHSFSEPSKNKGRYIVILKRNKAVR